MQSPRRSCRAPKAEICQINRPPDLKNRFTAAPGLEVWTIGMTVGYREIDSPKEEKEMEDLTLRLLFGRVPDRRPGDKPVDVMIAEYRCLTNPFLQKGIVDWAREKWAEFYSEPSLATPVITGWSGMPVVTLQHGTYSWADDRMDTFHDARIYDGGNREWSLSRPPTKLLVGQAVGKASIHLTQSTEPDTDQEVVVPIIVMAEDSCSDITEQASSFWIFWPVSGIQLGYRPALAAGQVAAVTDYWPKPAADQVNPFIRRSE